MSETLEMQEIPQNSEQNSEYINISIQTMYFVIRFEYWSKYDNLNDMIIFVRDCISPQVFCHCRLSPSHLLRCRVELRLKLTGIDRMLIFFPVIIKPNFP